MCKPSVAVFVIITLLQTGAALATDPAYWSARYGGWSREPSCEHNNFGEFCRALTVGKNRQNQEVAFIAYVCNAQDYQRQGIVLSFWTTSRVKTGPYTLSVRWDAGREESLETLIEVSHMGAKRLYVTNVHDVKRFLSKVKVHDLIEVVLPMSRTHGRPIKVKFPMKNAIISMEEAARLCGVEAHVYFRTTLDAAVD